MKKHYVVWARDPEGNWFRGQEYSVESIHDIPEPLFEPGWNFTTIREDVERRQTINAQVLEEWHQEALAIMNTPEVQAAIVEYEAEVIMYNAEKDLDNED